MTERTAQLVCLRGDCRDVLQRVRPGSAQCCVTSPPYWGQRHYGGKGQIGQEPLPEAYLDALCVVFARVRDVLADSGVLWLNMGDAYLSNWGAALMRKSSWWSTKSAQEGRGWGIRRKIPANSARNNSLKLKVKDACGLPWRMALRLQDAGWYLRGEVIWDKAVRKFECGVNDRPHRNHETLFLLTKGPKYQWHGRCSTVWSIKPQQHVSHAAVFPDALVERCLELTAYPGDLVIDPFAGSGTTGRVANKLGMRAVLIDARPPKGAYGGVAWSA